ncbi:tail fiber protein [Aeromonas rivipollensis]|uniref:hypothetical protein n=1 Tax=Aeromonas rivipollensis TaxID=948519 RepID=UPI00399D3D55
MTKEKILDIIKSSKTIDSNYDIKINKGQGTNAASATRKDYVDSEIAKQVSKSGDTIAHLTINNNGYFKQNYGLESGYKISKQLSSILDTKAGLIVLGQIITTNQNPEGFAGTISIQRGSSSTNIITTIVDLVAKKAYNLMDARIVSTTSPRVGGGRLCKITHEGKDYIAYYSPSASARSVVIDGISWGIEPFVIPDATGYVLSDLISSTDTTRTDTNDYMLNNNSNERVPSWGLGEGQGFVMHGKTAIGGANDGWLRLNPFDAFTTGIYTGNGIIRHGGTSIQLGSLGDVQATTLYRPNDVAWGLSTGGYAAVSVKQNTSSSAHWLLGSYKSSFDGDMRAGIQVLSNDTGTMRIYTNMRTHYAEISNGNILVSGAQSSSGSSLTKKDYVDSQDALKLNKAGDTMTGALTITNSNAGINLDPAANTPSYILGRQNSVNNWYVGKGSGTNNDIQLSSYIHNTTLALRSDRIESNKSFYVNTAKVVTYAEEAFWKNRSFLPDLGVSSAVLPGYFAFAPDALSSPDVTQYGHGFAVNPGSNGAQGIWSSQFAVTHVGTGKLWHRTGINGAAQGNWKKIYTSDDKPTADDVGAVAKSGDSMSGQLTLTPGFVDTSVNAQLAHIGKDATKALYIRNMREHNSSAWVWEKLYNGSLYYSSGVNGAGTNKIRLLVSGTGSGEIYLGANADKRVYHEGFKPTAGDVGAAPSGYGLGVNAPLIHDRSGFFANDAPSVAGYPGNGAGFQSTYGFNRRAQIYMNSSGAVYSRFSLVGNVIDTSTPWATHYTTLNKPTSADIGAVAKAGDTMTGDLTVPAVLVSSAQNTSINALTRKDYVDAEVAKLLARIVALESK